MAFAKPDGKSFEDFFRVFFISFMFCRWTDVALLKTFLEAAMWEGKPLVKLSTEMKWFIEFSDVEIADLQKLYNLLEPMETLFTKLGSESLSTIQLVLPTLLVSRVFFVSKMMIIDCFTYLGSSQ